MALDNLANETVYQILIDEPVSSILSYCKTSLKAHSICKDAYFWKTKALKHLFIDLDYYEPYLSWPKRYREAQKDIAEDPDLHILVEKMAPHLLRGLIEELRIINEGEPRIYFYNSGLDVGGFMGLSSELKSGVIAGNERAAASLLYLINYHVNVDSKRFIEDIIENVVDIENEEESEEDQEEAEESEEDQEEEESEDKDIYRVINIPNIINIFFKESYRQIKSFDLTDIFTGEVTIYTPNRGEIKKIVENDIKETDVWTIKRVESVIEDIINNLD